MVRASRSTVYSAKGYMVRVIPVKRVTDAMPQKILTSRRISLRPQLLRNAARRPVRLRLGRLLCFGGYDG
jgi:hypothetical protein